MTTMSTTRKWNFSAGPGVLPESLIQQAQQDLWDIAGTGIGVMEHSHRGPAITDVFEAARTKCRQVGNIPDDFEILFLQGGASLQFAIIPMAFLNTDGHADYINTGSWSSKAIDEARRFGNVEVLWDGAADKFSHIPTTADYKWNDHSKYSYYCSNNTIYGTRWPSTPVSPTPLIADMSSEMFARAIDWDAHDMVYAGAQKNLGPAGVTMVIIRKSLLEKANTDLPMMLRYDVFAKNGSMYNTPPVFAVYCVSLMFQWILDQGGVAGIEAMNERKAGLIYDTIDESEGFYRGHAAKADRSLMNITFRCPSEELEAAFLKEAAEHDMANLKGHRSVGGLRASVYNAFPEAGCQQLSQFMSEFARRNG